MKTIQPINIWNNGQQLQATILNAYAINVILNTNATFYYTLMTEDRIQVAEGNLTMSGADYQQWDLDSYAWDWISSQLNLTITGDYSLQ